MVLLSALLACGPTPLECATEADALLSARADDPAAVTPLSCACDGGIAKSCTQLATLTNDHAARERACTLGSGAGCVDLAEALDALPEPGRGLAAVFDAYRRGCEAADMSAIACHQAGLRKLDGRAGQSFNAALPLFEQACKAGYDPSCGLRQAATEPRIYVSEWAIGCDAGDLAACVAVARVMTPGDPRRARALRHACDGGNQDGCILLRDAP